MVVRLLQYLTIRVIVFACVATQMEIASPAPTLVQRDEVFDTRFSTVFQVAEAFKQALGTLKVVGDGVAHVESSKPSSTDPPSFWTQLFRAVLVVVCNDAKAWHPSVSGPSAGSMQGLTPSSKAAVKQFRDFCGWCIETTKLGLFTFEVSTLMTEARDKTAELLKHMAFFSEQDGVSGDRTLDTGFLERNPQFKDPEVVSKANSVFGLNMPLFEAHERVSKFNDMMPVLQFLAQKAGNKDATLALDVVPGDKVCITAPVAIEALKAYLNLSDLNAVSADAFGPDALAFSSLLLGSKVQSILALSPNPASASESSPELILAHKHAQEATACLETLLRLFDVAMKTLGDQFLPLLNLRSSGMSKSGGASSSDGRPVHSVKTPFGTAWIPVQVAPAASAAPALGSSKPIPLTVPGSSTEVGGKTATAATKIEKKRKAEESEVEAEAEAEEAEEDNAETDSEEEVGGGSGAGGGGGGGGGSGGGGALSVPSFTELKQAIKQTIKVSVPVHHPLLALVSPARANYAMKLSPLNLRDPEDILLAALWRLAFAMNSISVPAKSPFSTVGQLSEIAVRAARLGSRIAKRPSDPFKVIKTLAKPFCVHTTSEEVETALNTAKKMVPVPLDRVRALEVLHAVVKILGTPNDSTKTIHLPNFENAFGKAVGDILAVMGITTKPVATSTTSPEAIKQAFEHLKSLFVDKPSVFYPLDSGYKAPDIALTLDGVLQVVKEFEAMSSAHGKRGGAGAKKRSKPKAADTKEDGATEAEDKDKDEDEDGAGAGAGAGAGGPGGPKKKKRAGTDTGASGGEEAPRGRTKKPKTAVPLPMFADVAIAQGQDSGVVWGTSLGASEESIF